MKNKKLFYGILAVVISIIVMLAIVMLTILGIGFFLLRGIQQFIETTAQVTNFEECERAGYPVGESHPRQCWTPDGRHFVEKIDGAPIIKSIVPTSGFFGTEIIIYGSDFTLTDNDVGFIHPEIIFQGRNEAYLNKIASSDGRILRFNLPDNENVFLGACAPSQMKEIEACPDIGIPLPGGKVEIFVGNKNGISNKISFTVTQKTKEPTEYYGSSTYGQCQTNDDCHVSGCNTEICQSRAEDSRVSICVIPDKPTPKQLNYGCQCFNQKCQWLK